MSGLLDKALRNPVKAGLCAVGGLAAAFGLASSMYINEARQASLHVRFGDVVNRETTPGLKFKTPFLTKRYAYSLARQTTTIGMETTLRTSDDVRLRNPFTIEFQIDPNADLDNLYFQLMGTGGDIEDVVRSRARDTAVRVFEQQQVTDLAEPGFTDKIKTRFQETLQQDLQEQGWPVMIMDVLTDGFSLSPGSEEVLERIIDIRQEQARLNLREQNAQLAKTVYETEAEADLAYLNKLQEAGMPAEDLVIALQLKMARDSGRIMEPFAQVVSKGGDASGNSFSVAVDPENIDRFRQRMTESQAPSPYAPAP